EAASKGARVASGEKRTGSDTSSALDAAVRRGEAGGHPPLAGIVVGATPRLCPAAARGLGATPGAPDGQPGTRRADLRARPHRRAGIETWINRIVANTALDALRARRRRRQRTAPDDGREPAVDDEGRLDARAALRELEGYLADLPPDQRAAMVLKEIEELTSNEVAEVMGCSVGAVEQRLV